MIIYIMKKIASRAQVLQKQKYAAFIIVVHKYATMLYFEWKKKICGLKTTRQPVKPQFTTS